MKIYVGNLSPTVTDKNLRRLFATYGKVSSAEVVDAGTGETPRFGFILMPSRPEARAAISALQGRIHKDHKLEVKEAPPRAPRKPHRERRCKDKNAGHK